MLLKEEKRGRNIANFRMNLHLNYRGSKILISLIAILILFAIYRIFEIKSE